MSCELTRANQFGCDSPAPTKPELIADALDRGATGLQQIKDVLRLGSNGFKDGVSGPMVVKNDETGRLRLSRQGRAQAKAIWETVSSLALQTNEIDVEELTALFTEELEENVSTRLLQRSLRGRVEWEQKKYAYQMFEQQKAEELFREKYYPELGKSLAGAARFQYELSQIIKEREADSGPLDFQAEREQFDSILAEEAELERDKAKKLMEGRKITKKSVGKS